MPQIDKINERFMNTQKILMKSFSKQKTWAYYEE